MKQFRSSLQALVKKHQGLAKFFRTLENYYSLTEVKFRHEMETERNIRLGFNLIQVKPEHKFLYVVGKDQFVANHEHECLLDNALLQHKQGYKIFGVYTHLRYKQLQGLIKEYGNYRHSILALNKSLSQLLVEYKSTNFFNLLNYSLLYKSIIQEDLEAYCLGKPKEKPVKFLVGEYSLKLFNFVSNNKELLQRFQFLNDNISLDASVGKIDPEISYDMALTGLTRNFYSRIYFKQFKLRRYAIHETMELLLYGDIDPVKAIHEFNHTKYLESLYIREIRRLSITAYT